MSIKLQTIKDALEAYDDDVHEFKAFIAGLVAGAEEANDSQVEALGGATIGVVADWLDGAPKHGLIRNFTDNSYSLVNSNLMTDDDRKTLPLNVWIKHDGKSVPVLESGEYYICCGSYDEEDGWNNGETFEDEFLWKDGWDPVTAFMIKKIGV